MDNQTLFALVAEARAAKDKQQRKGMHKDWLRGQYIDGVFAPVVAELPRNLVYDRKNKVRSEFALQQLFNRAAEALEQENLDVLRIDDERFVIIDWNAPEVEEALSAQVVGS